MTIQAPKPAALRGNATGLAPIWFDVRRAAELWNAGRDTHDIGRAIGCHESTVYANLGSIRAEARGLRLAVSEPFHQASQDFAHRAQFISPASGQSLPSEATLAQGRVQSSLPVPAPFSQINDFSAHAAHSINSVSQTENGRSEFACVQRDFPTGGGL